MYYTLMDSPVGTLCLTGDGEHLTGLYLNGEAHLPTLDDSAVADTRPFREAMGQLTAYFAGELREFGLALKPAGTDFQKKVWQALCDIPFGTTASYKQVAEIIQAPQAVRAVGLANGRNPLPIVVPCHRVIGADGRLTGYSGGLDRKQWLLAHEARQGELLS